MIGVATALVEELPPRTRRIRGFLKEPSPEWGTTSAYAENTFLNVKNILTYGNYLRVRGEYE